MNRITRGLVRASVAASLAGAALLGTTATASAAGPLTCAALEFQYQTALANSNHYHYQGLYYASIGNQLLANYMFGYERHWNIALNNVDRC